MIQQTFVIIKPEGVKRGLIGEIISRFEKKALKIKKLAFRNISQELAESHYSHLKDKPFFSEIITAFTSGEVVLMVLEGEEAIQTVRNLIGNTDPLAAKPGTIRGDYGTVLPFNIVHASDSTNSAEVEINRFFG